MRISDWSSDVCSSDLEYPDMETKTKGKFFDHGRLERNVSLLGIAALITVAIGGIVEIAPLFWIDNTIEKVEGVRPYTPLELARRNIYIREGDRKSGV